MRHIEMWKTDVIEATCAHHADIIGRHDFASEPVCRMPLTVRPRPAPPDVDPSRAVYVYVERKDDGHVGGIKGETFNAKLYRLNLSCAPR